MDSHIKVKVPKISNWSRALRRRKNTQGLPRSLLPYNYDALGGSNRIRVVHLRPTKHRLECTLKQIDFSAGDYQALSYVWGSEDRPSRLIVFDGADNELGYIPVGTSLQHALCNLRDTEEITGKVFWIDQICINQEGDEKNHQVAMMGQIYQNASRVITYLGPASASKMQENRGIEILMRLYEHYSGIYEIVSNAGSLSAASIQETELALFVLPEDLQESNEETINQRNYEDQGWKWLLEVAYGEWNRRLWIVQEQMLCREIIMLRGCQLISWDAITAIPVLYYFKLLPRCYLLRFWEETYPDSPLDPSDIVYSVYERRHGRQRRKPGTTPQTNTLIQNMVWHEDLECKDPRDHIFALLGISADAVHLDITPDYSKQSTTTAVFLDASVRIFRNSSDLEMLILACRWAKPKTLENSSESLNFKITSTLPSWALHPPCQPNPDFITSDTYTPHPIRTYKIPQLRPENPILVLKGHFIDRISLATPLNFHSTSVSIGLIDELWTQNLSDLLSNWINVISHLGISLENVARLHSTIVTSASWTPTDRTERSILTSTAFLFWSLCRCSLSLIKRYSSIFTVDTTSTIKKCRHFIMELAPLLKETLDLDSFAPDDPSTPEEKAAYSQYHQNAVTHGRSFCATESGRTCNAMNQAREGDRVAALQGSDRLFTFRSAGDRYRLIGDAYVDGLMFGEAYEGVNPDDVDYNIEVI